MDNITSIAMGLIIILFIFLLVREIICWYWKINKQVELLSKLNTNIESMSISANLIVESTQKLVAMEKLKIKQTVDIEKSSNVDLKI